MRTTGTIVQCCRNPNTKTTVAKWVRYSSSVDRSYRLFGTNSDVNIGMRLKEMRQIQHLTDTNSSVTTQTPSDSTTSAGIPASATATVTFMAVVLNLLYI